MCRLTGIHCAQIRPQRDRTRSGLLEGHGRALFIQRQNTTFDVIRPAVPNYLLKGSQYNGGAELQYDEQGKAGGWVARRSDPSVQERFRKLLTALGKEFDGRISAGLMQSDRALRMVPAITEWCVGPALVAGPEFFGETARRQAPRPSRGLEPVETAAALHPAHRYG